jgi:hypothetical protein
MKKLVNFLTVIIILGMAFGVARADDVNIQVTGITYTPNMHLGPEGSEVIWKNLTEPRVPDQVTSTNEYGIYQIPNLYAGVSDINDTGSSMANGTAIIYNNTNLIFGGTDVKISLKNVRGRDVGDQFNVEKGDNYTNVTFDPKRLAKGTYFYTIEKDGKVLKNMKFVYDGSQVNTATPQPALVSKVQPKQSLEDVVSSTKDGVKGDINPGDVHKWEVTINPDSDVLAQYKDTLDVTISESSVFQELEPEHIIPWNANWRNFSGVISNGHNYTIGGIDGKSPISDVNVSLVDGDSVIANVTTGADGSYQFNHVPGGKIYTVELRDLAGEFRANKFSVEIPERVLAADTLAVCDRFADYAEYPGDGNFNQSMFEDPSEYAYLDTLGQRDLTCPELSGYSNSGMDRMLEGKGNIHADDITGRVWKFYNPNSTQLNAIRTYFNVFDGIPFNEVDNKYQIVGSSLVEPNPNTYNLWNGDANAGINLGTDGNNTDSWISSYDGTHVIMGAVINSGNQIDSWHEFQNLTNSGVTSEPSINGATAMNPTNRDIASHQYAKEIKQAIYRDGLHSGTVFELKDSVPDRKFNINYKNIYDLHR